MELHALVFIGRMIHVGVRREDRLGGSGREDVFIDDPDHVTFLTGGIEPAESTQYLACKRHTSITVNVIRYIFFFFA